MAFAPNDGVRIHYEIVGEARQAASCVLISLMIGVGLYSCSSLETPSLLCSPSCLARIRLLLFLSRLGNGRNELGSSSSLARGFIERLPFSIKRMVSRWFLIGRIENRFLEEGARLRCRHGWPLMLARLAIS